MKILIIEDEQSSADRLKRMLEGEHEIVGVCASNAEVRAFFADGQHVEVNLIMSDIQLGDGLSFESLKTVPTAIPVIFTTAEFFNEHHPAPHMPEQFDQEDGLFKFEKRMKEI